MAPFRFFILAVLFYLLYRLLIANGKKKESKSSQNSAGQYTSVDDVLVEDPICHTYIPKSSAELLKEDGKEYFFCSKECLKKHKELERR